MQEDRKFVDVGSIRTSYLEAGSGSPVLLIHGSGPGVTAWANWRLVIPSLAERFHVFAPDVVGFGYTDRPQGMNFGVAAWTEHLISFIETVIQQPVSIVGNSMGGALALHIARQRPDLVDKMVLMGSVGIDFELTEGLDKVWGYTPSFENMKELIGIFSYNPSLADNDDLVQLRYQASMEEGFQEAYASMFPAPRQRHIDAMALPEDEIRRIEKPTLLVHGREDRVIPVQNSIRLMQLLPDVELHVFSRCGHWTQIEQTASFVREVVHFFEAR
jgi:2-hydroxymuconate-semialdehyde hydrolase